jgi:hypothetical protein
MINDAIEFLKSTNNQEIIKDEEKLRLYASYLNQFSKMVCTAKYNHLKNGIIEIMRNDILVKNMAEGKEGKTYFIGKEIAHKHVLQVMDEIKNAKLSDLVLVDPLIARSNTEINLS